MFGNVPIVGWLIALIFIFALSYPAYRIGKRAGFGAWSWLGFLYFLFPINVVLMWVFAFVKWPAFEQNRVAKDQ